MAKIERIREYLNVWHKAPHKLLISLTILTIPPLTVLKFIDQNVLYEFVTDTYFVHTHIHTCTHIHIHACCVKDERRVSFRI